MIRIRYLGTGAAEGFPAPFCECAACEKVRRLGGKNRKTRCQCVLASNLQAFWQIKTLLK